ncbi:MAG TPA: response regulator [Gemmatimonadales bacterium]|jgi:DNA-binding NtrC family response regulator
MKPRILVVDDEPTLRRTLERALRSFDYDVITVGEPHLAYEVLEDGDFDLVLLDIHLPQMAGDALFLALVRRWPQLRGRVVLMTGDPGAVRPDWPAELLCCPVLSKPFTLDSLSTLVAGALSAASASETQRKRNGGHG